MNSPWRIWASFGLCLVIVLGAMGWTSLTVLRLEDQARRQAVREENVRLALWRMDSSLMSRMLRGAQILGVSGPSCGIPGPCGPLYGVAESAAALAGSTTGRAAEIAAAEARNGFT